MNSAGKFQYTYKLISRKDSESLPPPWRHCVHVMIHAPVDNTYLFNNYGIKNTILMQMRFDGRLGFPGGYVDKEDNSLEHATCRELYEEMGILPAHFEIKPTDYMYTHKCEEKKICLHFFIKEVSFADFLNIEKRNGEQEYNGFEVLGAVRVPLFVMDDKRSGFPSFLRNNFIGNAKQQLIDGIRYKKLLTDEDLKLYLDFSNFPDHMSDFINQKL